MAGAQVRTPKACAVGVLKRSCTAQRIGHHGARLARDQHGGGDVPFETPAQRGDEIGAIIGNHRHAQRDRVGLFDGDQITVHLGQAVGRHAGAGEILTLACLDRLPVERRALPGGRQPDLAARGRIEHASERLAVFDQRDRHRPAGAAADIIAGAVDRIDHPEPRLGEPGGVVGGFLRQPAGTRIDRRQPGLEQRIDLQIDLAHRAAGIFLPAFEALRGAADAEPAGFGRHRRDLAEQISHSPPSCPR